MPVDMGDAIVDIRVFWRRADGRGRSSTCPVAGDPRTAAADAEVTF